MEKRRFFLNCCKRKSYRNFEKFRYTDDQNLKFSKTVNKSLRNLKIGKLG